MKKRILIIPVVLLALKLVAAPNPQSLHEQGLEALNSGNYSSAELLFKRVMDLNDEEYRDRAQFYHARAIFLQKKYRAAIYEFNSYLNQSRSTPLGVESRYWIAESWYNLGEHANAIDEYKRFISITKDLNLAASAHDRIAFIYFSKQRFDEAVLEWDEAIRKSDKQNENALRLLRTGDALFQNGRNSEAQKRLAPLLTSNADPRVIAEARLIMGRIEQSNGAHQKALVIFNAIPANLMKESPFYDVYYFKTQSYLAANQKDPAKSQLDIFVHIASGSKWFYQGKFDLGCLMSEGKDEEKAVVLLEDVYKNSPDSSLRVRAALNLSRIYLKNGSDEAVPYLEEALNTEDSEERKNVMLLLGRTYVNTGRYSEAETLFREFMDKYPYDPSGDEVMFLQARISLEKGDTENARELLDRLRTTNPFSPYLNESAYYLAVVHYKSDDIERSMKFLAEYLGHKKVEKEYEAYVLFLNCYVKKNDMKNAAKTASILMSSYRDRKGIEAIIYQLAMMLKKRGDKTDYYFNWILKNFPESESSAVLSLMLAHQYYESGSYLQALDLYERYLASGKETDRGLSYYNRLQCLYRLQRYDEVIATIKKGQFPPMEEGQWKDIPLVLSRSYFQTGNFDKVYQIMFTDSLQGYGQNDLFIFCKSSLAVDDPDSAIRASDLIETGSELYGNAIIMIGRYYKDRKQDDRALQYFYRAQENGSPSISDTARVNSAEIMFSQGQYEDCLSNLEPVRTRELLDTKNALIILSQFKTGRETQALLLAAREQAKLSKIPPGKDVFLIIMDHHRSKLNIKEFRRYAFLLGRYPDQADYINYSSGELFLKAGDYRSAFYYFSQLTLSDNQYTGISAYNCGKISLLVMNNRKGAANYFDMALKKEGLPENIRHSSLIQLAILYQELNDKRRAMNALQTIFTETDHGMFYSQARNLVIAYDLDAKTQEK